MGRNFESHVSVVSTGGCILIFHRQREVKVTEKWKKKNNYIYVFVFTWVDLLKNLGPKQNFWVCFNICIKIYFNRTRIFNYSKKDIRSLDSIPLPSPSMTIQIMGRKVGLRCKGQRLLGIQKNCWQQPAMFGKKFRRNPKSDRDYFERI